MPTPSTFRIGGAFASAISCCRISSSMNVRPRPPYSLGQVRPMKPASKSVRCQRRRNSYCSIRGISELPIDFHSCGMLVLSQARTVAPKASCSGVSERSISPPEGGRGERLNSGSFSDPSRMKSRLILRPQCFLSRCRASPLGSMASPASEPCRAAWSDEEGRYGSLFGSRAFCGLLDGARIDEMVAVDGVRLVDAMARAGFDARRAPEARAPAGAVTAYVELHIEQGARLEEAGVPIGVVETIVGVRRSRVLFVGQADHAGTTPMDRRRDAFLAAADYALRVREHVVTRGSGVSVTNFGVVRVHPGGSNIVPRNAELVHEMRDPDPAVLERLAKECAALAHEVAGVHRVVAEIRLMSATTPAPCSPRVQSAIESVCATLGLACRRLYSAAGHDAQNLACITDAGMIFIPSQGGRSHRVDEMSDWEAIERGSNALLHTLLALAA